MSDAEGELGFFVFATDGPTLSSIVFVLILQNEVFGDVIEERLAKVSCTLATFQRLLLVPFRYCNSRVVKFNSEGVYQGQFGDDDFYTPHSLALAEELDIICVADRDNRR